MSELKLVTVYVSQGMLGAQVVQGRLESAGIPVLLKYEAIGQIMGLTVDSLGAVEVQVPADLAQEAEELLAEDAGAEDESSSEG
jgi:hypothetical protein